MVDEVAIGLVDRERALYRVAALVVSKRMEARDRRGRTGGARAS